MRKFISRIISYFVIKYNLHFLITDEEKVIFKIDNSQLIMRKDEEWHYIFIKYWIKKNKKTIYIDGFDIRFEKENQLQIDTKKE